MKFSKIRAASGLTLEELAQKLGTSRRTLYRIEAHGWIPRGRLVLRIEAWARRLGHRVSWGCE